MGIVFGYELIEKCLIIILGRILVGYRKYLRKFICINIVY